MATNKFFTGETLRAMVIASANSLEKKQEFLDSINVFPIPDGDTGLNLTSTLRRVVKELESCTHSTVFDVAKTISRGSFLGAKGNSGVILSQFMMGMASKLQDHDQITPKIFAKAMLDGSDWAYRAVLNPREGTILTVVRDASKAAHKKAEQTDDWLEVVKEAYKIANISTKETPNLLPYPILLKSLDLLNLQLNSGDHFPKETLFSGNRLQHRKKPLCRNFLSGFP